MMTREEVAEIITYCKDRGVTYKSRLIELGIPEWRFFESKARYAKEQTETQSSGGEFLQLSAGGTFVPMPSLLWLGARKFTGDITITINQEKYDDSNTTYVIVKLTTDEMAWQRVGTTYTEGTWGSDYRHFVRVKWIKNQD